MLIAVLAVALFALTGMGGLLEVISEYWPLLLLMMFSEAFFQRHVRVGPCDLFSPTG